MCFESKLRQCAWGTILCDYDRGALSAIQNSNDDDDDDGDDDDVDEDGDNV